MNDLAQVAALVELGQVPRLQHFFAGAFYPATFLHYSPDDELGPYVLVKMSNQQISKYSWDDLTERFMCVPHHDFIHIGVTESESTTS